MTSCLFISFSDSLNILYINCLTIDNIWIIPHEFVSHVTQARSFRLKGLWIKAKSLCIYYKMVWLINTSFVRRSLPTAVQEKRRKQEEDIGADGISSFIQTDNTHYQHNHDHRQYCRCHHYHPWCSFCYCYFLFHGPNWRLEEKNEKDEEDLGYFLYAYVFSKPENRFRQSHYQITSRSR